MVQIWSPHLSKIQIEGFVQTYSRDTTVSVIKLQGWLSKFLSQSLGATWGKTKQNKQAHLKIAES